MMFYPDFNKKVKNFAAKHYGINIQEVEVAGDFSTATAEALERHYEFDATGSVCLERRSNSDLPPSAEAVALFRRSQLLLVEINEQLRGLGVNIRDHAAVKSVLDANDALVQLDYKERTFKYRSGEVAVSSELITQALGGVAPLPILKSVVGALGNEIEVAISEQRSDQRIGHFMIVVTESLPFPSAAFILFGITASEVERSGDFDCFRASTRDIDLNYDQRSWMLVDADLHKPFGPAAQVASLALQLVSGSEIDPANRAGAEADLAPPADAIGPTAVAQSLPDVAETDDLPVEDEPPFDEVFEGDFAPSSSLNIVRWPSNDANAPDYAYLANESETTQFTLNGEALRTLMSANSYQPFEGNGVLCFALRGARLAEPHEQENRSSIEIEVTRPDHRSFRCVIGFYFLNTDKLSVYTGSTVPCRRAILGYVNGGDKSNMLPTGMYAYYVWRHKGLWPALRLSSGNGSNDELEYGSQATVLRTTNDTILGTKDSFDLSRPYDNIHCSYYTSESAYLGAYFSSWGCLTVRGKKTPSHQWRKFQRVLDDIGSTARVDLLLATGKDAALAAEGRTAALQALRQGSQGEAVERLQSQLGLGQTGYFGPVTADRFTAAERRANIEAGRGAVATGILTPTMASDFGWSVFASS